MASVAPRRLNRLPPDCVTEKSTKPFPQESQVNIVGSFWSQRK